MQVQGTRFVVICGVAAALVVTAGAAVTGAERPQLGPLVEQAVRGVENPDMPDSCGTDAVLVLDASGSIASSNAVDNVRDAGEAFLDALADTGSTARVLQFATFSEQLAAFAEVTTAAVESGVFREAIEDYYNPKPPWPDGVDMYSFRGSGNPSSASSWNLANSSSNNQYTNWDASLNQAGETPAELVVYVTDGDPTAYDFDQPGDPFSAGPPPDVGINTNRGDADEVTMDRAVAEADAIKLAGTRVLAVGVGSALQSASSRARLIDIAGPNVIDDDDLDPDSPNYPESINDVDVALVEDFDELAGFLRGVVSELCSPSLSIRKLAQTPDSIEFTPAPGWNITVTPSVEGGSFGWILPDTDPVQAPTCGNPIDPNDGAPRTCLTNATGLANFQWEPDPSVAPTSAIVTEQLQDGYIAGREGDDNDWVCRFKNIDGTEQSLSGELDDGLGFEIDVEAQQIITCVVYNSFIYEPAISLTKTNAPVVVRGDLPEADRQVTSTYVVQNTGNTPLHGVDGGDYLGPDLTCSPIVYLSGDDGDAVLDHDPSGAGNGEAWTLECTSTAPRTSSPEGGYENTAVVFALSPDAQRVTAEDNAFVEVVNPAIELEKQVAEDAPTPTFNDLIEVLPGADVVYSFTATNTGDTVLTNVMITDPDCDTDTIDPASVPSLAVGASAEFTCTAAGITESVINVATVEGTPAIPGYVGNNPPVTDTDVAEVIVLSVGIMLDKTVEPRVVFEGDEVTYTYVVSLRDPQADAPLRPSDGEGNTVDRLNWVTDARCVNLEYVSGDVGDDSVLEGGEQWTYSCTKTLTLATVNAAPLEVNIASVIGYPADEVEFDPELIVTDFDGAVAEVVQADIEIVKRANRGTVVDPTENCGTAQLACSGPDFSPPRTVDYTFDVSNPGRIPVDLTGNYPVEPVPDPDDARIVDVVNGEEVCATTTYAFGDEGNSNGLLDPGETWTYTCDDVTLTIEDATDGTVTDTVTVTGNGVIPGDDPLVDDDPVQDVDSVDVEVLQPDVTLTKTVSPVLVRPGGVVTYTFTVTNTGNAPLTPQGILDDRCTPVGLDSGDDGDFVLEPGEAWVLRCVAVVESPDDPNTPQIENEVVNVASAALADEEGNVYVPSASAVVRVFDPAIDLVKTVDDAFVPVGSDVTYTFTVTNTGDDVEVDMLHTIELFDVAVPALPVCRMPERVDDGDGDIDGVLAVGEVWIFECSATINANTVNGAAVFGRDLGDGLVQDVAGQYVAVFEVGIDVVKSATPTQLPFPGGLVTYAYEVRNTGDVPLADVASRITDDTCGPVTYVSGDDDANQLLTGEGDQFETGPPEVWIFTCTMEITQDTTNVVTANGTPVRPAPEGPERLAPDVVDTATAFVDVLPPPTTTTTVPPAPLPPTPGPLPPTGGGGGGSTSAAIAIALLAGGAALVLAARRRQSASA